MRNGTIKPCLIIIVVLCMLLGGCEKEAEEPKKVQIGISFDTFVLERWMRDRESFLSTIGKGKNAEVDSQSANGDVEAQIQQIQTFIDNKVEVIVIVPVDCDALSPIVNKAIAEGIRVISYDRLVADAPVDLYISFDNVEVGRLMAEALIEKLPEDGNVMMICGPVHDHNSLLVAEGFDERIEQSTLTVTERSNVKDWTPEYGFYAMESIEEADITEIDGVMCGNDGLAGYAIRALAEQRLAGQIHVVGQDADLEACQRIVEGTQTMTAFKNFDELGRKAAEYALALAAGEQIPETTVKIQNGEYTVPCELIKPIAITADNMQEEITDIGFHIYDQVYLNVKK